MSAEMLDRAAERLASVVLADHTRPELHDCVIELARGALGPASLVTITLVDDHGRPVTAAHTDRLAAELDQRQYDEKDGPCLDAIDQAAPVVVADLATVGRWPRFTAAALDQAVRAVVSVPLTASGPPFGSLNLYAREVDVFAEVDEISRFAAVAAVALRNAEDFWAAREQADGLRIAMESRAVIEQAKGKLMAGSDCTPDEAFQMLVRASQREQIKLREVARRIVEGRQHH